MRPRSKSTALSATLIEKNSGDESDSSNDEKINTNSSWSPDGQLNLLCQVKRAIPENDKIPFSERMKQINWHQIEIHNRSSADIKAEFFSLIESSRTFRILEEIIRDKHSEIIPKLGLEKPKPAFLMFLQDNKDKIDLMLKRNPKKGSFTHVGSIMFKESSLEVQEAYRQRAKKEKEKYDKLIAVYELPKGTRPVVEKAGKNIPMQLYLNEQMLRNPKCSKLEARKEYKNLPKQQKLKWILRWIGLKPGKKANKAQYLNCQKILTKTEMEIFDEYEGRPKFMSAYNMFMRDSLANKSVENNLNASRDDFKSSILEWKNLPEEEKAIYVAKAKALKNNFLGDFTRFVTSLPLDRQDYEINRLSSKEVAPKFQTRLTQKFGKKSEQNIESDEDHNEHDENDAIANESSIKYDEYDSDEEDQTNANKSISSGRHDSSSKSKASQTRDNEDDDDEDDSGSYNYQVDDDRGEKIFHCDTSFLKRNVKQENKRDSSESKLNTRESPKKHKTTHMTILHSTPNVDDSIVKFAKSKQQSSKQKPTSADTDTEEIPPSYKAGIGREGKHKSKVARQRTTESISGSEDNKTPTKANKRKVKNEENDATDSKKFKTGTTSSNSDIAENREKMSEEKTSQLQKKYQKILQRKPPETLVEYYAQMNFEGSVKKANKSLNSLTKKEKQKIEEDYEKARTKYAKKFEAFAMTLSSEEISHFSSLLQLE